MAITINASTSSGLIQSADTSGQIELQTNGTTVATVNTSNNVQFRSSISVGNATPTTSGAGITFPATQSASTDANTLDDYEEGTWTPTITPVSGTITTSTLTGTYTKVGRLVSLFLKIVITNKGTATGTYFTVGGRPFTPAFDTCGVSLTNDTGVIKASDFQTGVWYMYVDSTNNYTYTSQVNYYV